MTTTHLLARACRGALLTLSLASAGLAQAANDYFLQIDGIKGESTDREHNDWIDIESFSWGLTHTASSGGGGGSSTGKVSFSDLAWTQLVDVSTPKFFLNVANGKHIRKVTLDVAAPGGKGVPVTFFQMVFTDTVGSALKINGSGNLLADAAMTSGSTVLLRYRAQDGKGNLGDWVEGSFDIKANSTKALFSGDETVLMGLFSAGGNINFDSSAVTPVPEPATAGLLLGGLALLAFRRQRAG